MVQCGHGLDPEGLLEKWEKEETERYFMESAPEIVLSDDDSDPEAQKPGWQSGIATRKVFARPESFCA